MKTLANSSVAARTSRDERDDGFTSAQYIGLMAMSLMLLATIVNVLMIEYMRAATFSSLRDAARTGTRVVDLERAVNSPDVADEQNAITQCQDRLEKSLNDLFNADPAETVATCEIIADNVGGGVVRYSMRSEVEIGTQVNIVPWARPFRARLDNLSATYEQRQVAQ